MGFLGLGAGVVAYFAGLFFHPLIYDHGPCVVFGLTDQCYSFETQTGWCFMSWYIYLNQIGIYLAILFWSVAGMMFVPLKFSLSFIPASLFHAFGWVKILHITFFARSYETFHAWPVWEIVVIALALGFGIVMSSDALLYWENHKKRGNWQRWPAVHKANMDQALKNKLFDELTEEYYKVNKMI